MKITGQTLARYCSAKFRKSCLTELRILQFKGLSFKTLHAHKRAANTHGQFRNCLYLNFVAAERIYHDISTSSSKQRTPTNAQSRFIFQHSQKHAFTKPILEIGMGVPPPFLEIARAQRCTLHKPFTGMVGNLLSATYFGGSG